MRTVSDENVSEVSCTEMAITRSHLTTTPAAAITTWDGAICVDETNNLIRGFPSWTWKMSWR